MTQQDNHDVAPLPVARIAELTAADPARNWLIDELWSRAAVGIIGGAPKCCKSWLGLDFAVSVASGTPCLDTFAVTEPGPALLYMAEDANAAVKVRVSGICRHRGIGIDALNLHLITASSLLLDQKRDRQRLAITIDALRPRLLLLDPFVRLHRGDENDARHISALLAYLRNLQREYDLAVVVVHHCKKNGSASVLGQNLRGSGDFHAWTDSSLYLQRKRDQLLLAVEHRAACASGPHVLQLAGDEVRGDIHLEPLTETNTSNAPDLGADILAALIQRPRTRTELRQLLHVRNQRLGVLLEQLQNQAQIQRRSGLWQIVPGTAP